jgi:hypothetical protein
MGYILLTYVSDMNILGDNTDAIKKNTESLIGASKEVGLKISAEETMHLWLLHHNTG